MKRKQLLKRLLTCSLSFLILVMSPTDFVFAQNQNQQADTEVLVESETEQEKDFALLQNPETEGEEVTDPQKITETQEVVDTEVPQETEDIDEALEISTEQSENVHDSENLELQTASIIQEGTDGNLNWSLDSDGALIISGTGNSTKQPWRNYKEQIKTATIEISNFTSASYFLSDCVNLTNVDLSQSDFSECTYMTEMFSGCKNLNTINGIEQLNTGKVKSMSHMFNGCSSLTRLDLSNFDTSNVTDMKSMFRGCSELIELDVSNFDTSNVTDMRSMFYSCKNLTKLDVSNFDTSNVMNMYCMFYGCSSLTMLDVSKFDTANVTNTSCMFYDCSSLTKLDINKFDTTNVTNMGSMFYGCSSLSKIDVSTFNTANVTNMRSMFYKCSNLTELDLSNFITTNVSDMSWMYFRCSNLTKLDVSKFDTANVTDTSRMFYGCSSLTKLDVSKFDTANVTDTSYMFYDCSSLTKLDVSKFDTANVTDMSGMFGGCSSLTKLDVSKFDTANVTDMSSMFEDCSSLTELELSKFQTSNVTIADDMFFNCSSLKTLNLSSFDLKQLIYADDMLNGTTALQEIDTPKYLSIEIKLPGTYYTISEKAYTTLPLNAKKSVHLYVNKPVKYVVIFDGNGSTSGSMSNQSIRYGTGTKLTANSYKKKGYSFAGWNTKKDGSGKIYANQADGSKLTKKEGAKVTLYAQWKKKTYTITYELNGGTNHKENPTKYNIKTATITLKNPTRKGYTFKGWYTDSSFKTQITQIKKGSTGNKTFYAKWSANKYTITFDGNKSTSGKTASLSCKYGKEYTLTSNGFKRKGYTFVGWNTKKDGSGKTYKNKAEIKNLTAKANGKVTLYAQWKKK